MTWTQWTDRDLERLYAVLSDPDSVFDREGRREIRKRALLTLATITAVAVALGWWWLT